jgi:hypothetical protein
LPPNRNERQIRPLSKNRSDRWIVCRGGQANALGKSTGYRQIGRACVDKDKLPRLKLSKPSFVRVQASGQQPPFFAEGWSPRLKRWQGPP